jgi:hypothetical protein
MRTHISKSLQTRCRAIQNAVKTYNTAAAMLYPPRPLLKWSRVSQYAFLEEFNLLHETRQDIHSKLWVKPVIRETIRQYLHIQRAEEEILCCNVEVRRLHSAILSENKMFDDVVFQLRVTGSLILPAVEDFCTHCRRINAQLLAWIHQIHALKGFSGHTSPGDRAGIPVAVPGNSPNDNNMPVEHDEGDKVDEEVARDMNSLVDYISDLILH